MSLVTLIDSNIEALQQAKTLLQNFDDSRYTDVVCDIAGATLGSHVRHIVEHYDSFFQGLDGAFVDYDARPRDMEIEQHRSVALKRIDAAMNRLTALVDASGPIEEHALSVRLRTSVETEEVQCVVSTVARELVFLHGHTTHHFAQMAFHLRAMGESVDKDFGMAPSTQVYLQSRSSA